MPRPPAYTRARRRLAAREQQLRTGIASAQARGGEADLHDVVDRKEEANDLLLATIDSAGIERDVDELRRIEAVRECMDAGTYGVCADCGEPIEAARLQAQPTALRCTECQAAQERHAARHRTPHR